MHQSLSDSGVGDYGQNGIDSFIEQHECQQMCLGLAMEDTSSDDEGDDE